MMNVMNKMMWDKYLILIDIIFQLISILNIGLKTIHLDQINIWIILKI